MENLAGLKTDEAFALIAKKVSDADGSTQSLNAVIDIFGKKAKKPPPNFAGRGNAGAGPADRKAKELSQLMDEQFAADAEKFKTGWDKVVRVAEGATAYYISLLGKLKDAIKNTFDFTDASEKSWNPVKEFYRKWEELRPGRAAGPNTPRRGRVGRKTDAKGKGSCRPCGGAKSACGNRSERRRRTTHGGNQGRRKARASPSRHLGGMAGSQAT
jgi:hypothetical protein